MHLKSDGPEIWRTKADTESLMWWSLRSLDTLLSSITGRSSSISDRDCNLSLPRLLAPNEAQQISVGRLQTHLKINIIAHWGLSLLYSINARGLAQYTIQKRVLRLTAELETLWPAVLSHQRPMLHYHWFYTMILITRPCLSRSMAHNDVSSPAVGLSELSERCVQAAQSLVGLFPEQPSEDIFRSGPWWCMTHYIMQAMDVLILSLSASGENSKIFDSSIPNSIKKLILWLQWMAPKDAMAQRALTAILESRQRAGDNTFTDLREQDDLDIYGEYALPRWDLGLGIGAGPAQYLNDAGGLEDLVPSIEPAGALPSPQRHPGFLPIPPGFNDAFSSSQGMWDW